MPGTMADTHLVIFAHAALHREAWRALLSGQPGIRLAGAAGDLAAVTSFLPIRQPSPVLGAQTPPRSHPAARPPPPPDPVRRLKAAVSDCGLLLLVNTYDLGEVIPLLQAGATGCISRDSPVGDLARGLIAAGCGEIRLAPAPREIGGQPGGWLGRWSRRAALRPRSRIPAAAGAGAHQQRHGPDVGAERAHGGGAPAQHLRQVGRALTHGSGAVGRETRPRAAGIGAAMGANAAQHGP